MDAENDLTRVAGRVLLTRAQVLRKIGLGRSWLYDAVREGRFPQPVRIGARVLFIQDEVEHFIEQLAAARPSAETPAA